MDVTYNLQSSSAAFNTPLGAPVDTARQAPLGPADTNPALSYAALNADTPHPRTEPPASASTAPPTGPDTGPVRILLVDDHEDMLNMMKLILSRQNYTIATANSGAGALQLMATFAPDVIISDISMPGMDGYELMSALRAGDQGTTFKAIALSGYGMEDDRQRAQTAGYDAHLTKPLDFDVLFALVTRLVETKPSSATT